MTTCETDKAVVSSCVYPGVAHISVSVLGRTLEPVTPVEIRVENPLILRDGPAVVVEVNLEAGP